MTHYATRETQAAGLDGFLCCWIGSEQYAIRGADVRNVARADAMARSAGAHGQVGVLRDGTSEIAVFSLAGLFGHTQAPPAPDGHIAIVRGERAAFGLMVDRVVRSTPEQADLLPLPPFAGRGATAWFEGLLRVGETACLVLVPPSLDPRGTAASPAGAPARSRRGKAAPHVQPSDMVVTFSTTALPHAGTTRYAVSGHRVAALVQSLPSVPLPGRSAHIKELAWWQSEAVPILEFQDRKNGNAAHDATRYLVARCGNGTGGGFVAFRVDPDVLLHRATENDGQVVGRDGLPFVRGIYKVSGECVALLDLDALTRGVTAGSAPAAERVPALI